MAAHVSFVEVATLLGTGASFLVLAVGLGRGLVHFHITPRDASGRLRKKDCAVIAISFALLIVAHSMALWWFDLYHPAINGIYGAGAAIAATMTRAKPVSCELRPR
jgi:hypothetical protein